MKKFITKNSTKAMAFSIASVGLGMPINVLADGGAIGPKQTMDLTELEDQQGVKKATAEDVKAPVKSGGNYVIRFGMTENDVVAEGEEFAVYPAYITRPDGSLVKIIDNEAPEVKAFLKENTKIIDHNNQKDGVTFDIDGVYHVRQIKRAPGKFLNRYLGEGDRDKGYGDSLGFEFPKTSESGVIEDEQVHVVNPKKEDVDTGQEEGLTEKDGEHDDFIRDEILGGDMSEIGSIKMLSDIILSKYGDNTKTDSGFILDKAASKDLESNTIEGARFTIKRVAEPIDTYYDVLEGEVNGKFAPKEDLRNEAKFQEMSESDLFAELEFDTDTGVYKSDKLGELQGLPEGVYELKEVVAPKGYILNKDSVYITVTVDKTGSKRIMYASNTLDLEDNDETKRLANGAGFIAHEYGDNTYGYKLNVNNIVKPGVDPNNPTDPKDPVDPKDPTEPTDPKDPTDPKNPTDPDSKDPENEDNEEDPDNSNTGIDKKSVYKASKINGVSQTGNRVVNPGQDFAYNIGFALPKDISEYKYFEIFDNFNENLELRDMTVELKNGNILLTENTDFKVHVQDQQRKVVLTEEGLGKLDTDKMLVVLYNNVRVSEDLSKTEVEQLMNDGIYNVASLHYENGTGEIVNPQDPLKVATDEEGSNPHMVPNSNDPFNPTKKVADPELPEGIEIEVPQAPRTNALYITPTSSDFEFTKINNKNEALEGAKFKLERLDTDGNPQADESLITVDGHELADRVLEATSDTEGKVKFEGLPMGKYRITEIEAPNGYRISTDPIELEITGSIVNGKGATILKVNHLEKETIIKEGEEFTFKNFQYNETPETGTLGKVMYLGAGALVITIGTLGLKKKED